MQTQSPDSAASAELSWIKAGVVLAVTAVMVILLERHTPRVNGPTYWTWAWRQLPAGPVALGFALGGLPALAAVWLFNDHHPRRSTIPILLLLPMASAMALKLASAAAVDPRDPLRFDNVAAVVQDPGTTSYYTDAAALSTEPQWLALYPQLMPRLNLHSQSKPPGPVAYYRAFIRGFGYRSSTATLAGIVLGALATLSIPLTYLFLHTITGRAAGDASGAGAAFAGACFLSLCPGFLLFFPMMDPVYPVFSCALGVTWARALERDRAVWSLAMGAILAAALFATFNLLVFGFFLACYGFAVLPAGRAVRVSVKHGVIALATCVLLYAIFWAISGYDPIATFASAWRNQHVLLQQHATERPYPRTILWDLLDFAMGSGWISVVLAVMYFLSAATHRGRGRGSRRVLRVSMLAIAQLLLVAVAGLLQSETARVWNFLLPLLCLPIGVELSTWPRVPRLVAFGCLLVIAAVICRNMQFV